MNSIDQYYEIARRELAELAEEAKRMSDGMQGKLEIEPMNRPIPVGISDMRNKLATIERLMARYSLLCDLGIKDVRTHDL